MTVAKAIARAWRDPDYKARLLEDPRAALAEVGLDLPADMRIEVVADNATTRHVVLPQRPREKSLSQAELESIAAAGGPYLGAVENMGAQM